MVTLHPQSRNRAMEQHRHAYGRPWFYTGMVSPGYPLAQVRMLGPGNGTILSTRMSPPQLTELRSSQANVDPLLRHSSRLRQVDN